MAQRSEIVMTMGTNEILLQSNEYGKGNKGCSPWVEHRTAGGSYPPGLQPARHRLPRRVEQDQLYED